MMNRNKLTAILCTGALLLGIISMPVGAYVQRTSTPQSGQKYVEGEVLALVDKSKAYSESVFPFEQTLLMDVSNTATESETETVSADTQLEIIQYRSSAMTTNQMMDFLANQPNVLLTQPNYLSTPASLDSQVTSQDYTKYQWSTDNVGANDPNGRPQIANGVKGEDCNAKPLYDAGFTGSRDVVVAVMDTGVDYTHPDLANQMWSDGKNYPELVSMGGSKHGICGVCASEGKMDTDPMDDHGHGTHVAGIIGASWNGSGISGVNENVQIMAIKARDHVGNALFPDSAVMLGFEYVKTAKKSGVNVVAVNCSFGSPALYSLYTIAAESLGKEDILTVWSSGNSSSDNDLITGDASMKTPYAIIVNSSNASGGASPSSSYGTTRTLVYAPGQNIVSTVPAGMNYAFPGDRGALYQQNFETLSKDNPLNLFFYTEETGKENHIGNPLPETAIYNESLLGGGHSLRIPVMKDVAGDVQPYIGRVVTKPMDLSAYNGTTILVSCELGIASTQPADRSSLLYMDYRNKDGLFVASGQNPGRASTALESVATFALELSDETMDLSKVQFAFSLESDCEDTFIDNLSLYTRPSGYAMMSGTSMATPMVTGEVALLKSIFPNASAKEISARIAGGVKRSDSFKYCVSGGRIDIEKAVYDPFPVLQEGAEKNGIYTVDGYFFGDKIGSLTFDGKPVDPKDILAWSSTEIQFKLPTNLQKEKLTEISVMRNESTDSGRNFFLVSTEQAPFEGLPMPSVDFSTKQSLIHSENGVIYGLFAATSNEMEVWSYIPEQNSWNKLSTPTLNGKALTPHDSYGQGIVLNGDLYTTYISDSTKLASIMKINLITGVASIITPVGETSPEILPQTPSIAVDKSTKNIYFAGGTITSPSTEPNEPASSAPSALVYKYNVTDNQLTELPSLSTARIQGPLTLSGGTLMIAGGQGDSQAMDVVNSVDIYDEKGRQWQTYTNGFPVVADEFYSQYIRAVPVKEGMLLLAIPKSVSNPRADAWLFDKTTKNWSNNTFELMSTSNGIVLASTIDGYLYLLGTNPDLTPGNFFRKIPLDTAKQQKLTPDMVSLVEEYTYTGNPINPTVIVSVNANEPLIESDYTCTVSNNQDVGIATVQIRGKGNYYGTVNKSFTIRDQAPSPSMRGWIVALFCVVLVAVVVVIFCVLNRRKRINKR